MMNFRSPLPPRPPGRRLLTLAVSAALLSACASPSPSATALPDTPVPAEWSVPTTGGPGATVLAQWWQRFNDPQLTALVSQALQANTSVRSAQAALQQARAQRDVQTANAGPSLGVSASAQRSQTGSADAGNRFQAGFDASWEPDVFGGNRATVNASEADARAAETSLGDVQVSLAAEVAASYIELRGLQARLAIANSNLALQAETLQITRWRNQAGLASSLDVEQAVASTEQTRAQIPSLQTSVTQSLNALAVLTGQAPGALQASLGTPAAVPQTPGNLALAFPAETLRQRPDVRTAELRIGAALARLDAADAARYPSFRLSGSLGLSALTLGTLTDGASVLRSLLASVSVPLLDGGAAKAQVRAQAAALEQARVAYQATVLTALKDVEDALVALQGDTERLARLQAAATAAANAELLARQRYQSGLIDFRTVLDTQRTLLSTQDSVASTQASLSADHVRLYKALGGGWTPEASGQPPAATR
jgi:outer membrane protein, multidrug efflux system